jgi:hypothetical protein
MGDRFAVLLFWRLKIVEWSDEDNAYVGRCPGLFLGGVHGYDELEVYRELCKVVEEWFLIHQPDGIPVPPPTAQRETAASSSFGSPPNYTSTWQFGL